MIIYTVSFTDGGDRLNNKICGLFKYHKINKCLSKDIKGRLSAFARESFADGNAVIFIGAVGIAVRSIAPFVTSKASDPAVVVCDELGRFAIPILSGHIGGANGLALFISEQIGAQPVLTTATDINGKAAIDVWAVKNGFHIHNIERIKDISSALLRGERVGITSDIRLNDIPRGFYTDEHCRCGVVVSPYIKDIYTCTLNLVPRCVTIGAGSKRGASSDAMLTLAEQILRDNSISPYSVKAIATIDIKRDEECMAALCQRYGVKLRVFTAEELNGAQGNFTSSAFVKNVTGTDNVCERAAVLAGGTLAVRKTSGDGVTTALAIDGRL